MDEDVARPTRDDDREAWNAYWTAQGMSWRTEPDVAIDRQRYLTARRAIPPNDEQGDYPFKGVRLGRADVEWLLATHESMNVRGPVHWEVEQQKPGPSRRQGLDLRGAILRETDAQPGVDLSGLPLALVQAGAPPNEQDSLLRDRMRRVSLQLYRARRAEAHFERANLSQADLRGANLYKAHLEYATLYGARLEGAQLSLAYLNHALFYGAHLEGAEMSFAVLEATELVEVHLGAGASEESRSAPRPLDLRGAEFDNHSALDETALGGGKERGYTQVAYVDWDSVNLSLVDWTKVHMLGDEYIARHHTPTGTRRMRAQIRRVAYEEAAQANHRLAIVLRNHGLSDHADRFAYRAHLCQRVVLRRQHRYLRYLGSMLLWLIAGYGYKPLRSFIAYAIVIAGFAAAYIALTNFALTPFLSSHSSPLTWYEALVLSVSSFHGRGLFPTGLSLGDPVAILAAIEAIIGLLIEITFIATFTQRFFAR